MIRAVYFDLDGTLFDDRQYVRAGLLQAAAVLESRTGVDAAADLLEAYFRRGVRERTFDAVLDEHDLSRELVPDLVAAYHANDAPLTPFPDARQTLETLADSYRLGLITGGTNGRDKLRRLGLADYFDLVVVTADGDRSKTHATVFEEALDELDAAPRETVYVGDRPDLDFPQPNRLGMHTVRVRTGRFADVAAAEDVRPDAVIDALDELPDVLAALQRGDQDCLA